MKRVLETWGNLQSLELTGSQSLKGHQLYAGVKISQGILLLLLLLIIIIMELPNQDKIRTHGENETYKYLGILEADTIRQVERKDKIQKEYPRRKLLETKLSSRNLIKGINTWAVPLVRYSRPFLKWTRDELKQMDQRTRKLKTMHKILHPRDDVDRL